MTRKLVVNGASTLFTICVMLAVPAAAQNTASPATSGITLLDAVRYTLEHHPLIGEQKAQVTNNRGLTLQASAPFDTLLQSGLSQSHLNNPISSFDAAQLGIPVGTSQVSNLTNLTFSAGKLFRNGVKISPSLALNRDSSYSVNPVLNTSQLGFVVTVPLLRGLGRSAVDAPEIAAATEVEASLLDLNQLMAQLMANTGSSYWNLVASRKLVAIALEAEHRGEVYVDNVKALIEADHVPRSDLDEVAANLADRSANRFAADQQVVIARQQLALDMGTSAYDLFTVLDPTDDFPPGEDQPLPADTSGSLQSCLNQALQHRADFLAAKRRIDKARVLRVAAKNALLPQLNLSFESGYTRLDEGRALGHFFASPAAGNGGVDATVGVSYSFPPANSDARGQVMQADAFAQQNELQAVQVARNISTSVVTALEGVRNAILRVKKARESVESFRLSLDGQRERYRVGMSPVVDVLTVEDRLNNALSSQVQAQLSYALALIQFRLATGTIIAPDQPAQTVRPQAFNTLPFDTDAGVCR
jgi:outer membrane protein